MNEELAKRLAAAAISVHLRVSYQTAYKHYCADATPGQFWLEMAELAQAGMSESLKVFEVKPDDAG